MSAKDLLEELVLEKAPGPSPSFTVFDIIKVLEMVVEAGSIGRGRLSENLGLGEGATRTVIARLTDAKLISTSKTGCSLTAKGKNVWKEIKTIMPRKADLEKNALAFAAYNVAVQVKGRAERVKKGLEQRDASVRAGAKGASTLIFRGNKLILPTISTDLAKDYTEACRQITRLMDLEENDVVIISSADNHREAEYGALAAAWTIV